MSEFPRPRMSVGLKREITARIIACDNEAEAGRIAESLWSKLRGDMQDRITGLIYVAMGAVEAKDMNSRRGGLRRALNMLRDTEIAAATIRSPRKKKPPARKKEIA